ncbi:MAG: hypothetical protein HY243_03310 [Proteobacteria bacterium]|nr:hypothetical protein [Pseudomonadota bacterium]
MQRIVGSFVFAAALLIAQSASAGIYTGKIALIQTVSSGTIRFWIPGSSLSLLASGDARDIMLQAFYRKATVSANYTPTACAYTGTCGTVNLVTVDASTF